MSFKPKHLFSSFLFVLVFTTISYSATIDRSISSGNNDAYESSSGAMSVASSSLWGGVYSGNNTIGLRFENIEIPQGTQIISAYIDLVTYNTSGQDCYEIIRAELSPNPSAFLTDSYDITSRATTMSSVSLFLSGSLPSDDTVRSGDLVAVVQEVVDQTSWSNGNSMVVIIQADTEWHDFYAFESGINTAPKLHIEYAGGGGSVSIPVISVLPAVSIGADATVGTNVSSRAFTLQNNGGSTLNYSLSENASWLSCTPLTGNLSAGASTPITVTYSTSSLSVGNHETAITITDRDVDGDGAAVEYSYGARVRINPEITGSVCGDVPVYTENLVNPAILLLLDVSGSMAWDAPLVSANSNTQHTPDLSNIIQETVDRSGWLSGNSMVFIVDGTGSRIAVTHDASGDMAPLLHVDYTDGGVDSSIDVKIDQDSDDAEEDSSGYSSYDYNDLILGAGNVVGLRFRNLSIPPGAVIQSAYIEFVIDESGSSVTDLTVAGQADDSPAAFTGSYGDISSRTKTAAFVAWNNVPAWNASPTEARLTIGQDVLSELVTDRSVAWGFGTWTSYNSSSVDYTDIHVGTNPYSVTQEQDLIDAIDAAYADGGTPLTPSLLAGRNYFAGTRADEANNETYANLVCQPKMVIEITDGIGNTGTTVANVGTTTALLADDDITVVGVGFSIDNAVQLDRLAEVSNAEGAASDDDDIYALHKEDANGVAQPFLANSKDELIDALNEITTSLKSEIFHGSAPAPTTSVDYGNIVITAQFSAVDWSGDLIANEYDADSGALGSANWSAIDEMPSGNSISAYTLDNSDAVISYSTSLLEEFYLCKPLGDIINSTPIIVEDPAFYYSFNDYGDFRDLRRGREKLVYIGANDGALHAFGLADGVEKWRFYPKSLHSDLNPLLVDTSEDLCFSSRTPSGEYCHKYFVDGSPVAADVFDGTEWSTILVTGLGHGGSSYFTLDISGGGAFGSGDDAVSYLWEFTDSELGFATSEPAISRVYDDSSATTWAVFFGSGYSVSAMSTKEAYLFGLHVLDKSPLWEDSSGNSISKVKMATGTLLNDALSSPLVVNFDDDDIDDHIYAGNLYGSMYRVVHIGATQTPTISKLFDFGQSSHVNPLRSKAAFAYDETDENVWIYFGSGKYEDTADKTTTTQQYFLGLKDNDTLSLSSETTGDATYFWNASANTIGTPSEAIKEITARKITVTHSDSTQSSYRTLDGCTDTDGSWLIKLNAETGMNGSERVISEPMVAGGIVFFTTFIPDVDVCAGNGEAWLFAVKYKSGCSATGSDSVFDINNDGSFNDSDMVDGQSIVGIYIGAGQPSKPVLEGDIVFVTTTGGGLKPVRVNLPDLSVRLKSWRTL